MVYINIRPKIRLVTILLLVFSNVRYVPIIGVIGIYPGFFIFFVFFKLHIILHMVFTYIILMYLSINNWSFFTFFFDHFP